MTHIPDSGIFSQLFDHEKQPAFAYSATTFEILDANAAAVRLLKFPRSKLIGCSLVDLAPRGKAFLNRRRLVAASSEETRPFRLNVTDAGNTVVLLRGVTIPIQLSGKRAGLVILGGRPSSGGSVAGLTAARALKQANYEREIRRHEALAEFNHVALNGLSHAQLLGASTRLLRDSLEIDFCLAFELRERDGVLTCTAADGWTGDIDELRFDPLGTTIAAKAFQSHEPVTVSYLEAAAKSEEAARIVEYFSITSAIGIPIRDEDKTFGSICAYSRESRAYDASEIRYMQTVARVIAIAADRERAIGEAAKSDLELTRLANVDVLTALPNRRQITSRIAEMIAQTDPRKGYVAVCCLDLDRFKSINQSLGQSVGDDVLVAVGERLLSAVRPGDLVGRLGSDEFVAVFARVGNRADLNALAAKVRLAFSAPLIVNGKDLFVTVSGGISFHPTDGDTPEELLRNADAALDGAKQAGRDQVIVYVPGMRSSYAARVELLNELHRAVERDEFRIHLQPIVDGGRKRLVGFEALARWAHPTRGLVLPADFIPAAEQTGLIIEIGRRVLFAATALAARWQSDDGKSPSVSVNVSARQFGDDSLVNSVSDALSASGLAPQRLCLEVTESAIVRDMQGGAATLRSLRDLGVAIAIDDFGTGYSSMNYLRSFAFDILKIDRSFVQRITDGIPDASIARGIIALGHAMSMKIIAEGVETEEQASFLQAEGCDEMQGYLISKPVPEEMVAGLIERFACNRV